MPRNSLDDPPPHFEPWRHLAAGLMAVVVLLGGLDMWAGTLDAVALLPILASLAAIGTVLCFLAPIYVALRRLKFASAGALVVAGAISGIVPFGLPILAILATAPEGIWPLTNCAIAGGVAGLVFWLTLRWNGGLDSGQPDSATRSRMLISLAVPIIVHAILLSGHRLNVALGYESDPPPPPPSHITVRVAFAEPDIQELRVLVRQVAADHQCPFQDVATDTASPLDVLICTMRIQMLGAGESRLENLPWITLFVPPDAGDHVLAEDLVRSLQKRWPTIRFEDANGREIGEDEALRSL